MKFLPFLFLIFFIESCIGNNNKDSIISNLHDVKNNVQSDYIQPDYINIKNNSKTFIATLCRIPRIQDYDRYIEISNNQQKTKTLYLSEKSEVLFSSNNMLHFIVKQGDSLLIKDVNERTIGYTIVSFNDSTRSNELNFFYHCYTHNIPLLMEESFNLNLKFFNRNTLKNNFTEILKVYNSNILFANQYFKKYPVSVEFQEFMNAYTRFDFYNKIYTYISNTRIIDSLNKANFFDFSFDTLNEYNTANFKFYYFLINDYKYKLARIHFGQKLSINKVFNYIDSSYSNSNAEYLKFYYLKINADSLYKKSSEEFKNNSLSIKAIESKEVLKARFEDLQIASIGTNSILDKSGNELTFSEILKRNKGNVIYIDFWASWCAPCRREFFYYDNLKKYFINKQVSFIFISIDKLRSSWKQAYKAENLDTVLNNYLLINPSNSFLKDLNLASIPRYILISKDGKIINNDAPRPSNGDLLQKTISKIID